MFFNVDEKTIAEMIKKQQQREEAKKKAEESTTYNGHKLQFVNAVDGNVVILSDPPLITEAKDQNQTDIPLAQVDLFTGTGWMKKST